MPDHELMRVDPVYLVGSGDVLARTNQLVAGWLLERPSENTRAAYRRDLELLARFLAVHGGHLLTASRGQIAGWGESMRRGDPPSTKPASEVTVARRYAVASSFYAYAVQEEAIPSHPMTGMKRPKRSEDEDGIAWLDLEQMRAFLTAAADHSPRLYALVAVMLTTGARVSEITAAEVADLGHTGGHRVLTVTRKGGKRQHLPLAPWVGVTLDRYLKGRGEGPLFATRARDGGLGYLDEPAIHRLIRRLAEQAGLPKDLIRRLRPHSLRHSAITGALDAGSSLRDVQAMAGHADPRTTERYDRSRGRLDRSPVYALASALAE